MVLLSPLQRLGARRGVTAASELCRPHGVVAGATEAAGAEVSAIAVAVFTLGKHSWVIPGITWRRSRGP